MGAMSAQQRAERTGLAGLWVAVIGMARTGIATARALAERGAVPFVFDTKPESDSAIAQAAQELRASGIEATTGWTGALDFERLNLIVPSPGVPRTSETLVEAQAESVPIWSEIELGWRIASCPSLMVTGTNGKSTTTALCHEMALAGKFKSWLCGNIAGIDEELPYVSAASQAKADDRLVAEVSSFQLEWVHKLQPQIAILTTLQPDHLDRYDDFSDYARTKGRLFANQTEDDWAILNADDEATQAYVECPKSRVLRFSVREQTDAWLDGGRLMARWNDHEHHLADIERLGMRGIHNVANALAASLASLAMGVNVEAITDTLERFPGLSHRMELVAIIDGVRYINNSMCTNAAAMIASIRGAETPVVVIAGGVNKGPDFSPFGALAREPMRRLLLIGRDAAAIRKVVAAHGYDAIEVCSSLEEAVRRAKEIAETGDSALLAPGCASFDMFADFRARGEAFKKIVYQLMEGK